MTTKPKGCGWTVGWKGRDADEMLKPSHRALSVDSAPILLCFFLRRVACRRHCHLIIITYLTLTASSLTLYRFLLSLSLPLLNMRCALLRIAPPLFLLLHLLFILSHSFGVTRFSQLQLPSPRPNQKSEVGDNEGKRKTRLVVAVCSTSRARIVAGGLSRLYDPDDFRSTLPLLLLLYCAVCSHERKRRRRRRRREKGKVIIIPLFRVWRGVAWRTQSGKKRDDRQTCQRAVSSSSSPPSSLCTVHSSVDKMRRIGIATATTTTTTMTVDCSRLARSAQLSSVQY